MPFKKSSKSLTVASSPIPGGMGKPGIPSTPIKLTQSFQQTSPVSSGFPAVVQSVCPFWLGVLGVQHLSSPIITPLVIISRKTPSGSSITSSNLSLT